MTMFRKVFGNQIGTAKEAVQAPMPTLPERPEAPPPMPAPMPAHVRATTDPVLARGPDVVAPPPTPAGADQPPALTSAPAAPPSAPAPAPAPSPAPPPAAAPEAVHAAAPVPPDGAGPDGMLPDPALAQRAAEAHRQMLQPGLRPAATAPQDPAPPGPAPRGRGRARTRLLGFDPGGEGLSDPFANGPGPAPTPAQGFPTGWVVVTEGPGRGQFFALYTGVAMVGRGEDQAIRLDFGDTAISRQNHAALAYDPEGRKFYLGHGGKSNIIRLNGRPVLSTEELSHGDVIRIGETHLRFVALCGNDFQWEGAADA